MTAVAFVIGSAITVLAVVATARWAATRFLGQRLGLPRTVVVGVLVFLAASPAATAVSSETELADPRTGEVLAPWGTVTAVLLITFAWVFLLGVALLVLMEVLVPTGTARSPVSWLREALRQRERTRRYAQVTAIFARHGLRPLLGRKPGHRIDEDALGRALAAALDEAGVTFIKLGQIVSTRTDVIPPVVAEHLARLQTAAGAEPWPAVRAVVEAELGHPVEQDFAWVDPEPLAAASVAQVHAARLLDGTEVVLKVQRPAAREQVQVDLDILGRVARWASGRWEAARGAGLEALVAGFAASLRDELDYRNEATSLRMVAAGLAVPAPAVEPVDEGLDDDQDGTDATAPAPETADDGPTAADRPAPAPPTVHVRVEVSASAGAGRRGAPTHAPVRVPTVYPALSSTRLLVMERIDGPALADAGPVLATWTAQERQAAARALLDEVLNQLLVTGVFHADLHPGNVALGPGRSVTLLDLGAIGVLDSRLRRLLLGLLAAVDADDAESATTLVLQVVEDRGAVDRAALLSDLGQALTVARALPDTTVLLGRLLGVFRRHHLALPPALAGALRTLGSAQGTLALLDPDLDLVPAAQERVPELARELLTGSRIARTARSTALTALATATALPGRFDDLTDQLATGRWQVRVRPLGSRGDREWLASRISDVVLGVLAAVFLLAGVLLLGVEGTPMLTATLSLGTLLAAVCGLIGAGLALRTVFRQMQGPGSEP